VPYFLCGGKEGAQKKNVTRGRKGKKTWLKPGKRKPKRKRGGTSKSGGCSTKKRQGGKAVSLPFSMKLLGGKGRGRGGGVAALSFPGKGKKKEKKGETRNFL